MENEMHREKERGKRMIVKMQVTTGGSGGSHLEGRLLLGRWVGGKYFHFFPDLTLVV
jgi:hypothetical protein